LRISRAKMLEFFGISQGWKLTGAIKTAERKLADGSPRHSGQGLMAWAVANARVEPKGNAIIITKQGSGSAKIDPLMVVLNALALKATTRPFPSSSHGRARQSFSGAGASTGSL
jgi:phage terminase large subunit-like protein